ncbi:uncharacterized protein N7483_000088 [Penicillium malachiteum]|uniref:uncharacterized protein n=1 Tax=Penicillium malachiteum TaxID=1324776 RepID=UPI002548A827|nr:uncharacterized protein N7483_000088 [Penicillium malachiteum]KAJ5734963.1 hypothetical protein N7483_000088 [Penicillium malachiteum]
MNFDTDDPEIEMPEELFLDLTINDVLDNAADMGLVEPWASMYVSAIREKRYGDAIWARYHILGDVQEGEDGYIEGTEMTVHDRIEMDAAQKRVDDPDMYAECLEFYEDTSEADGHPEIAELITLIGEVPLEQVEDWLEEQIS